MGLRLEDRILGALVGGAVGDALGAPFECLHKDVIRDIAGGVRCFEDLTPEVCAAIAQKRDWGVHLGLVTDDTVLADLLLDCILTHDGQVTAYQFAAEWLKFEEPVVGPDGQKVVRMHRMHFIERIPYFRNQLREIPKRELGHGEANATNAIMYIAPVGLLCAGDPLKAELMAVDITSVNQHGRPRDLAGAYAAMLAACFLPQTSIEDLVRIGIEHTRDWRHTKELRAMVDLARTCRDCTEFIDRYYTDILGRIIPYQDLEHEDTSLCNSWNSAEILGPTLATLLISGGDAEQMMLACAKIGRDADTICRCAGGLIGAYKGLGAIPRRWTDFVLPRNAWLRTEDKAGGLAAIVRRRLEADIVARKQVLGE